MNKTNKIVALAKKKIEVPAIAAKLKLHISTVYLELRKAGVKPYSSRNRSPLADRKRVLSLIAKVGPIEAARQLKVSKQAIYLRFRQWRKQGVM